MNNDSEKTGLPPYVSFSTFKNFLEGLSKTTTPKHIDKSMMPTLSGGSQSQIITTLRAMGLIKTDGESTPELHALVSAVGTEDWPIVFGKQVSSVYAPIIGDLNITHATPKQLDDRFKLNGKVDGASMINRCVRFYMSALKDAKMQVSPHLTTRKPRGAGPRRNTAISGTEKPAAVRAVGEELQDPAPLAGQADNAPPAGMIVFPVYFRNKPAGKVLVPIDISPEDCGMFDLTLQSVKAYAAQQAKN